MATPIWREDEKRWVYRPYDKNGKQLKITSTKEGKPGFVECKKKYSQALVSGNRKEPLVKSEWNIFIADVKKRYGADSEQHRKIQSIGKTHILPVIQNYKITNVTNQKWQDIINNATPHRGGREVLSKKTLKHIRNTIMMFCKFAKKNGTIDNIPDDLYIPADAPVVGKNIIQPELLADFLKDDSDEWYLHAWQLMIVTGMRPGECYALQRKDVDGDFIYIRRSIRQDGKITKGKNANAIRVLMKTKIAQEIIDKQIKRLNKNSIGSSWLFASPNGLQPNPVVIWHHWEDYRVRFPYRVTLYGLRHTFVSLLDKSMPKPLLQMLVGHSEYTNTSELYSHVVTGDDQLAANIVDATFNAIMTKLS